MKEINEIKETVRSLLIELHQKMDDAINLSEKISDLVFETSKNILRFHIAHFDPDRPEEYLHCLDWDKIRSKHERNAAINERREKRVRLLKKLALSKDDLDLLGIKKE